MPDIFRSIKSPPIDPDLVSRYQNLRDREQSKREVEKSDRLDPPKYWGPQHWISQVYQEEYKSLPKLVKFLIRYGSIILAFCIALDYGSRHARSAFCQWGWNPTENPTKFCETIQTDEE